MSYQPVRGSSRRISLPTIRLEPRGETIRTVFVKCGARLPIHLAHPLKDEHAVVIHALGPSLQGSR